MQKTMTIFLNNEIQMVFEEILQNIDLGPTKHMTSHRVLFNTHAIFSLRNKHLGNNNMVKAIGMESAIVGVEKNA